MIRKYLSSACILLCLLLCVFLIGRVVLHSNLPLHAPRTTVQRVSQRDTLDSNTSQQITLDSGALTTLITRQLPADFPITDLVVQLTQQGSVQFTGTVDPGALSLPRAASALLPNPCHIMALVSLGYQDDQIILHPQKFEIGGLTLPHALLTPITDELADAILNGLHTQGIYLQALAIEDGILYITLKP